MKRLSLLAIAVAVGIVGCGRTGIDDSAFATQSVTVGDAPDSGIDAAAGTGGRGAAGATGAAGAAGHAAPTTATIGGFDGTLHFCATNLDCPAGTPLCCAAGAVKVCEPGPVCASTDEDGDNDQQEHHR
jgi:hypothetical protein